MTATYVACLTPPGRAAIATVAVRGPLAWEAARQLFRPARGALPEQPASGQFWFGRLGGNVADEVVLAVRSPWLEVHCHGGPEAVRLVMDGFAAAGARPCSWQEFLEAFAEPGTRTLAEIALPHAPTVRTASILLDQTQGALDRALLAVRDALQRDDDRHAEQLLGELTRFIPLGRHLTQPWRVAVAGPPNVGKSSLVNALAGFQRCVVSPTPGTTRDVVTTLIAVDGWPVELADTAGLRDAGDELEGEGIARARRTAETADLCLWVLDASAPPVWPNALSTPVQLVINKVDLPAAWDITQAAGAVPVSARTGAGLGELCSALASALVPELPPPGAAVPFTDGLCALVDDLRDAVQAGRLAEARRRLEPHLGSPCPS